MIKKSKRAALLWTGGKDSCLALHETSQAGYDAVSLVTFAPKNPQFHAHPLPVMKMQADALQIVHKVFEINDPIQEGYVKALETLQNEDEIGSVITGDIDAIAGHPNWIRECCRSLQLEVIAPLWGMERNAVLRKVLDFDFEVVFSYVKKPWLTAEWVGRRLDSAALVALQDINKATGMDLCGEQGEYHTVVLDAPLFHAPIRLERCTKVVNDSAAYLELC